MGKTFLEAVRGKYEYTAGDVAAERDLVVSGEGQREEKKWEMVGMEKLKQKTGQLHRLVSIAVGDEGVTDAGDLDELRAALPAIAQLELSGSTGFRGWTLPATLTRALETVSELDLSLVPLDDGSLPGPGSLACLVKLVLTGTASTFPALCAAAAAAGGLPALRYLYLDGNALPGLQAGDAPPLAAPRLEYLSLIENRLSSWAWVDELFAGCPALTDLILTDNELPAPTDDAVEVLARQRVRCLSVGGNRMAGAGLGWVERLGAASSALTTLRLTYPEVAGVAPNHVRLMVIAVVPTLAVLNSSTVTAKERGEAEKYYINRAFNTLAAGTKHKDDCTDLPADFLARFAYYKTYVSRWSNPSTAATTAAGGQGNGLAELTLRDCIEGSKFKPDVTRPLPVVVKVAQLKAVVKAAFQVDPQKVVLVYKSLDCDIPVPTPLDNDLEPLTYYGITGGRGVVEVSLAE